MQKQKKPKCLHNRSVDCDVFNDTINCWYESFMQCRQTKHKREQKKAFNESKNIN
jgi:hypothetical protein